MLGEGVDLVHRQAMPRRRRPRTRCAQGRLAQFLFQTGDHRGPGSRVHAVHADFQAAQGFLERFLEGAAHGHHLAHRLSSAWSGGCRPGIFEGETRDLGDHVVDGARTMPASCRR